MLPWTSGVIPEFCISILRTSPATKEMRHFATLSSLLLVSTLSCVRATSAIMRTNEAGNSEQQIFPVFSSELKRNDSVASSDAQIHGLGKVSEQKSTQLQYPLLYISEGLFILILDYFVSEASNFYLQHGQSLPSDKHIIPWSGFINCHYRLRRWRSATGHPCIRCLTQGRTLHQAQVSYLDVLF
jgi:hypothetical protein